MNSIIIFLIGGWIGAELSFYFIYSPKAQVKRLWKQINKLNKLKIDCGNDSTRDYIVNGSIHTAISNNKKKINILLDYYFDSEEDEEYISKNRP